MAAKNAPKIDVKDLYLVNDFQPIAEKKLSETVYGYFANGADDEQGLRRNCSAYDE